MNMNLNIELETFFLVFFGAIVIDFLLAVIVAAKEGRLRSRSCSDGMYRSAGELIILGIALALSKLIPNADAIVTFFTAGFIFKEGISIMGHLVRLDVWLPESLIKLFENEANKVDKPITKE